MKTVRAKRSFFSVTVPVRGGCRASFFDHLATLPDHVADYLVGMAPEFYRIAGSPFSVTGAALLRLLVVRDMGLGDVLMTTPLIRALHGRYGAIVDVMTSDRYRCLFDDNPHVNETFALETTPIKAAQYDAVIDLRLSAENAERFGETDHRVDHFAQAADITLSPEDRRLDYFVSDMETTTAKLKVWDGAEEQPLIGYVWASSCGNRNWTRAKHDAVIDALLVAGMTPVILGHERVEMPHGGICNLTGALSIRMAAAVISQCAAVVTPDTGLFHVAQALGVPTVGYFGAFPAAERATSPLAMLNEHEKCPLMPCRKYNCLNRTDDGDPRCLDIDPARVAQAVLGAIHAN